MKAIKALSINTNDSFIVHVYALDNTCFQSTVLPHNDGHACVNYITHQLGIEDTQYFGLRHITDEMRAEWIDLDKPLAKQLAKFSQHPTVYFGVMNYISRAFTIEDKNARFQYFQQLHVDYIHDKYDCLHDRAIRLASYYLRATLGQYDPEKHTSMSMSRLQLFPFCILKDERISTVVTQKAFKAYQNLNIDTEMSITLFIMEFESTTYYGLECHPAAFFNTGEAVHLITSYSGILIKYLTSPTISHMKWVDIIGIKQSRKACMIIETKYSITKFRLVDKKRAKYFFKMVCIYFKFYETRPLFSETSSKEPVATTSYVSHSLVLSSSPSETVRSIMRYQQSLTSIPADIGSPSRMCVQAFDTVQPISTQTSHQEQTTSSLQKAVKAFFTPKKASSLQVPYKNSGTTDIKTDSQPTMNINAAEAWANEGIFPDDSLAMKPNACKRNVGTQTLPCLNFMVDDRFRKYPKTHHLHLISQAIKNILLYVDELENSEHQKQRINTESKVRTETDFSDLQSLKEVSIRDSKRHTTPHQSVFKEPISNKDTLSFHRSRTSIRGHLKKNTEIHLLTSRTSSISSANTEKTNVPNVVETQTMVSSSKELIYLEPKDVQSKAHGPISQPKLLLLSEPSKGAIPKHSKKPVMSAPKPLQVGPSKAFKAITDKDIYVNLQHRLREGYVFAEFQRVGLKSLYVPCSVGSRLENYSKNRIQTIIPYDVNRVRLSEKPVNVSGYINASHLKWKIGNLKLNFIAAQAPLENTVEDFWQMVWEQKVSIVIMLNSVDGEGKAGCYQYWPREYKPEQNFRFGSFTIIFHTCRRTPEYVLEIMSLTDTSGKSQLISNFSFTQWSQDDCPCDVPTFVSILEEIDYVQKIMFTKDSVQSPIVVMCHDGAGRTGVLIMSLIMKYCLKHDHKVNMQHFLGFLRSNRMHMVSTQQQYNSVYEAMICYLKGVFPRLKSYLIGPFKI